MLPSLVIIREYITQNDTSPFSKWFKGIEEYRIHWSPGYRIYLAKDGDKLIILFGGGTKKSQAKDIEKAVQLHNEYKQRKKK